MEEEEEEKEVEEKPEPSEDNEEVENEAELAEPTVSEDEEAMTEADGATKAEEEAAGQSEPSEDNEVTNEADLPDATAVEQVLTKVIEEFKVEEGRVDTVGENTVEEEDESVSKEPDEGKSIAPLRDEDGRLNFLIVNCAILYIKPHISSILA